MSDTLSLSISERWQWVTSQVAVGADLHFDELKSARQLAAWQEDGITHVLDMRMEWNDREIVERAGFKYLNIRMHDRGQQEANATFDKGVEFAREAIDSGGAVLAHCHMGINRGPSMAFAIVLDQQDKLDPFAVFEAVAQARPVAYIWYAYSALVADIKRRKREERFHPDDSELRIGHLVLDFKKYLKSWHNEKVVSVNTHIRGVRSTEGTAYQ